MTDCTKENGRTVHELWEVLYGECLYPKPENESFLRENFEVITKYYDDRNKNSPNQSEEERELVLQGLRSRGLGTRLSWEEFCKDHGGFLSRCLRAKWAHENGFDLSDIGKRDQQSAGELWNRDPASFLRWIERNCRITPLDTRLFSGLIQSDSSGTRINSWKAQMALLATVSSVMEFTNGERVFLSGFEEASPRADELQELEAMESASRPPAKRNGSVQSSESSNSDNPTPSAPASKAPRWSIQHTLESGTTVRIWEANDSQPEDLQVAASLGTILKALGQADGNSITWVELGEKRLVRSKKVLNGTRKKTLRAMATYKRLESLKLLEENDKGIRFLIAPEHRGARI